MEHIKRQQIMEALGQNRKLAEEGYVLKSAQGKLTIMTEQRWSRDASIFSFGSDFTEGFGSNNGGWVLLDEVEFKGTGSNGVDEENNDHSIIFFPNPSTNVIHINSKVAIDKFIISNQLGQVVSEGTITNQTIDISTLEKNIYFLSMIDHHHKTLLTKKIIKF